MNFLHPGGGLEKKEAHVHYHILTTHIALALIAFILSSQLCEVDIISQKRTSNVISFSVNLYPVLQLFGSNYNLPVTSYWL